MLPENMLVRSIKMFKIEHLQVLLVGSLTDTNIDFLFLLITLTHTNS